MTLPLDTVIRRIVRNPPKAHSLDAPQLVRVVRRILKLHTARKLSGEGNTGLEPAILSLKAAAKRLGVVWDAEEKDLIKRSENE